MESLRDRHLSAELAGVTGICITHSLPRCPKRQIMALFLAPLTADWLYARHRNTHVLWLCTLYEILPLVCEFSLRYFADFERNSKLVRDSAFRHMLYDHCKMLSRLEMTLLKEKQKNNT